MQHDRLLIIDFGSQVTQLIARRLRELHVYCEIHPFNRVDAAFLAAFAPRAVIFSGGPASVFATGVTRQALHNVIAGRSAITPEMAVRLEQGVLMPASACRPPTISLRSACIAMIARFVGSLPKSPESHLWLAGLHQRVDQLTLS